MPAKTILELKNGNHQVFKIVFDDWHAKVYNYFYKKTESSDIAKELTQETFIKFWNYRSDLSENFSLDQQIFQKARQIFIDWLRREATQRKYFTDEIPGSASADLQHGQILEENQKIEWSLSRLSPRRRKVFEMKHLQGYSYREIARNLNITEKTVDNHLLKATSQLRKVFNL